MSYGKCKTRAVIEANENREEKCVCEIVEMDDDICTEWGIEANEITKDGIAALMNGKALYFDDGEYAHVLYYKGDDK